MLMMKNYDDALKELTSMIESAPKKYTWYLFILWGLVY